MRLLAACCRWPPTPARDAAVRAAAVDIRWRMFFDLTRRHKVVGLAQAALADAGVATPAKFAPSLALHVDKMVARNTRQAAESARLQALFDAAGIRSVLIKGAALAQLAYGSQTIKHAKDVDLLVDRADLPRALRLMEAQGYRLLSPDQALNERQLRDVMRYRRDIALLDDARRIQVELHWRLTDNPRLLPGLTAVAPTQSVTLGADGPTLRTLAHDELFAYLCVHGAAHGWMRLKWLADVAALLSACTPQEIERLYRNAAAGGGGDSAAQALLLADLLLGLPLPPALVDEFRGRPRLRRLVRIALDIMTGPGADSEIAERRFGQARLIRARVMLARDWREVAATAAAHLTALEDVLAVPLPRALHFCYPLLRLPLWLGRRARRIALPRA